MHTKEKKIKLTRHKGFQFTITGSMFVAVLLQISGEVGLIATYLSIGANMLWLWEEDISHLIFHK